MSPMYYERFMYHMDLEERSGRAQDALFAVVQSMNAISHMTGALLRQGEDQQHLAEGVFYLIDQQCALLNGIYRELDKEEKERKDERAAVGDFDQSSAPIEALLEPARKLRLQFIENTAKAGVDHADIARALNVEKEDIARMVARLRGEDMPPAKAARATRTAGGAGAR